MNMHPLPPVVPEHVRRSGTSPRRALLATTALQAAVAVMLAQPADAQPAPNARPTGGVVVAGQATISQSTATTNINQSSQNAAVNWQSFNVGSAHSVQINDPSTTSLTLNRVVGSNPSEIAGRIQSNGRVIIVNQAGLTVDRGAVINTSGLVVSSAGISNANLMAGKLIFDQPGKPNAKIENRGDITIANEGLAALVAPQVANSGVIRANMGKVILAGAAAHTLDLYGDGMVAINVTKQVTTTPDGGAALVTNTGVIEARGGSVVLTAQAVDGVVQTLVEAGGRITANSVAGHTGRVVIAGRGGDVTVTGAIDADGIAPGTKGGVIVANTTGTVAVGAMARLSVEGNAGGGTVALGTTYARAAGGPGVASKKTAKAVLIAAGSTISADATAKGNGGRVTVLSTAQTSSAGLITAKGGPQGGDGGFVEVSGQSGFALGGSIDVTAPKGAAGTILLDPDNLTIVSGQSTTAQVSNGNTVTAGSPPADAVLAAGTIDGFAGNIVLQAQTNVFVNAPITLNGEALSLTLDAITGNIQVNAPVTASGAQTLAFNAGANLSVGADLTTGATGSILLHGGTGVFLNAGTVSTGLLTLQSQSGDVSQANGRLIVGTLASSGIIGGSVLLPVIGSGTSNQISALGPLTANGDIQIFNSVPLSVAGGATVRSVTGNIYLATSDQGGITIAGGATVQVSGSGRTVGFQADAFGNNGHVLTNSGTVEIAPWTHGAAVTLGTTGAGLALASLGAVSAERVRIGEITRPGGSATTTAGSIAINGAFDATVGINVLELDAVDGITQTAPLAARTLTGAAGSIALGNTLNAIGTIGLTSGGVLGSLTSANDVAIGNGTSLTIAGNVVAGFQNDGQGASVSISVPGNALTINGEVVAGTGGNVDLSGGSIAMAPANGVLPVVKADGAATLTADTITQSGGIINAGTVDLTGNTSVTISGGNIIAVTGTIGFDGGPTTIRGNAVIATVNDATDINFNSDLTQSGNSYIGANGAVNVGGLLTQAGGQLITVSDVTTDGLAESGGLISVGGNLSVGTGVPIDDSNTSGPAGWAGSAAQSGSFNQTGGVIVVNRDANVFTTGNVVQTGSLSMFAAGGTLGITSQSDISIGGTVAASGDTGFMLLSNSSEGVVSVIGDGLIAGPVLSVATGNVVHGNAIQAPLGTVVINTSENQSIGTIGSISAANAPVGGYTLFAPGASLDVATSLPSVPRLQVPNRSIIIDGNQPPVPITLLGDTIDIEGRIVVATLGMYARSLITEGTLALINSDTLTGSVGLLHNGTLAADLIGLGWTDLATLGWGPITSDVIGSALLLPTGRFNNIRNLSDFNATGNFELLDKPLTPAQTVVQIGTLQAGSGVAEIGSQYTLSVSVEGTLQVNGFIVAGIDDEQSRPGSNVFLDANNGDGTPGLIVIAQAENGPIPVIAAVPNGTQGGQVTLTADSITQSAGVINAGTIDITANNGIGISGGNIVAVAGTIGFDGGPVTLSGDAVIATVNNATDINFASDLTQFGDSYIGANGAVNVSGLLAQFGGQLITVGDVTVGGVNQGAGLISVGGNFTVGTPGFLAGAGTDGLGTQTPTPAGWAGSTATSGSFDQSGGLIAVNGNANIFTVGAFSQSGGTSMLAAGGTLGVTSASDISIGGTLAASGATGFMLLSTGEGATVSITGSGLVAGPVLTVATGNVVHGNAIQAPLGTVLSNTQEAQSIGTIGTISAANTPVSGYNLLAPGVPRFFAENLPPVPRLQQPNPHPFIDPSQQPIPITLLGNTIDIEGRVVVATLGLYARTLITEDPHALINTDTLTGTVGLLQNSTPAADLVGLGWTDLATLGWGPITSDVVGDAILLPTQRYNNIRTLSDFRATGSFELLASPLTPAQTLLQIGTLQAGSAVVASGTPNTLSVNVAGTLDVTGLISGGIDDGQSRPGTNVSLTATDANGTAGRIVMEVPSETGQSPVIAAVPNGTQGGLVSLTTVGPNGSIEQRAGQINGGSVALSSQSIALDGTATGGAPNGRIIATGEQGAITVAASSVTIGGGETIAALDAATDVTFFTDVALSDTNLIQSNGDITITGLVTMSGGALTALGDVSLGGLNQTAGGVSAGGNLNVGSGGGVAGFGGSNAGGGVFNETGGRDIASGAVNVFTTGAFTQGNAYLIAGGTLGVTAAQGISIGGTVSASGGPSGFMLLANSGNVTLTSSGVIAGPQLATNGGIVPGNALQAPAGTVVFARGAYQVESAGAVGTMSPTATGYSLVCADCTTTPTSPVQTVPVLLAPTWSGPSLSTPTNAIPLVLVGATIDIASTLNASALGLYAQTAITEQPGVTINAATLTGGAGAASSVPAGLVALGWSDAAAIGWQNSVGNASLTAGTNAITTLADFATTGNFALTATPPSGPLTQVGVLSAGGAASLTATRGGIVQSGQISTGGPLTLTANAGGIVLSGVVNTTGAATFNAPGGLISQTGGQVIAGSDLAVAAGNGFNQSQAAVLASSGGLSIVSTQITIDGQVGGATVLLQSLTNIQEGAGGAIQAGLLTGSATVPVAFGSAANAIAALGAFSTPGLSFSLTDSTDLAVTGIINASSVSLLAPQSTVTLQNGSGFSGLTGSTTSPLQNQPFPAAGDPGLFVQAAAITNANAGLRVSGSGVPAITFALTGPAPCRWATSSNRTRNCSST